MNADNVSEVKRMVSELPRVQIDTGPGPFGGTMIFVRLGRREIGHLHPEGVAHFPFPRKVREELIRSGQAREHSAGFESHVETELDGESGLEATLTLMKLSYDRAVKASERKRSARD